MKIIYFHKDIKSFILSLENKIANKVINTIRLLSIEEYHLSMPFSKKLEKDLYELRILNTKNIRIFYTFYENQIVLLHIIDKKTQKLKLNDLKTARNRLSLLYS